MVDEQITVEMVEKSRPPWGRILLAAIIAFGLIMFVVQNTVDTEISWLFFDAEGPLWVVIVIAAVGGSVLVEVLGWLVRRSRRRR